MGKDREPAQSLGKASELLEERAKVEAKRVAEAAAQAKWIAVVVMQVVTAAGILAAWTLGRSVMRTLGADPTELVAFTEQLAKGKFAQSLGSARALDNSVLKHLDDMRQQWLKVVGQVSHSSQNIGLAAAEIAQGLNS
jgi:methyl-accepting chemotaxis protein